MSTRKNQRYNPKSLGDVTYADYKKCGLERMFRSFLYQLSDRIEDRAPSIRASTLVVRGEHDPIANLEWCEMIVRRCPRGRFETIPGVAHTLCFTAPVHAMTDKQRVQDIQRQLIQMTAAFCQQHADGEYERLCRTLIEKMARKRTVPFLIGARRDLGGSDRLCAGQHQFPVRQVLPPARFPEQLLAHARPLASH